MIRNNRSLLWVTFAALLAIIGYWYVPSGGQDSEDQQERYRVSAEEAAKYIHNVIQANRTVYTKHVVERLQDQGVVTAEEQWDHQKALPLPAQVLMYAGLLASETGGGIQYRLASLWPIHARNGPASEFEHRGLEAVAKDPNRPYTGLTQSGEGYLFKAVYADRAVSKVCVSCHNAHKLSPKKDYKLNDVMGGIVITFPVEKSGDDARVTPEAVADYVHTVIEADRTVYAKLVVDRLQEQGVVRAEEQWEKKKALPLPAQTLLYSGQLAEKNNGGLEYRLASLWPIYPRNGPATDFEQQGLQAVAKDPRQPYTGLLISGQQLIFKAVYADKAVTNACVTCHNGHKLSARKDYRLNDVMGGIIISFPVQEE